MVAHYLRGQAGKLLSLCLSLSLSLLAVSLAAPASAQPAPGVTPTAGAVDPDLNKHPFNRGESIYTKPDSAGVLRYQSVAKNKAAIDELAALVVEYEALEKEEKAGVSNEAKRRELGLKKVALYDKYNISLFMLSVPKSKMSQYMAFWPNFWRRVDEFKKNNPGIQGPGPFTLPREGSLSRLSNGAQSLAKSLGDALAVQEAVAADAIFRRSLFGSSDYPRCTNYWSSSPVPVQKCENDDDEMFFFQLIGHKNFSNSKEGEFTKLIEGVYTHVFEYYRADYKCDWDPSVKRRVLKGAIHRDSKEEVQYCGPSSGDAQDEPSKVTLWYYDIVWGVVRFDRYCLHSKNPSFERYQEAWTKNGRTELTTEPKWCDE